MKITRQTRFITNGRAYVRLGWFRAGDKPSLTNHGYWWDCSCYPANSADVQFVNGSDKHGKGKIPRMWLCSDTYPPLMQGFIGIRRHLIPAKILARLEK